MLSSSLLTNDAGALWFHNMEKHADFLAGWWDRATLCWCSAEFHIPPLWSLGRVSWCHVVHVFASYRPALDLVARGIYIRIARLRCSCVLVRLPRRGLFPCSSSRHRVRQAVEGGGLHQTHTLPGIACYLRCSGMDSRCGCRQNGLLVSLFYFLFSFTAFLLRLILSIPESYTRLSYIPGRFTIPDLMILRHVLCLGGRLI